MQGVAKLVRQMKDNIVLAAGSLVNSTRVTSTSPAVARNHRSRGSAARAHPRTVGATAATPPRPRTRVPGFVARAPSCVTRAPSCVTPAPPFVTRAPRFVAPPTGRIARGRVGRCRELALPPPSAALPPAHTRYLDRGPDGHGAHPGVRASRRAPPQEPVRRGGLEQPSLLCGGGGSGPVGRQEGAGALLGQRARPGHCPVRVEAAFQTGGGRGRPVPGRPNNQRPHRLMGAQGGRRGGAALARWAWLNESVAVAGVGKPGESEPGCTVGGRTEDAPCKPEPPPRRRWRDPASRVFGGREEEAQAPNEQFKPMHAEAAGDVAAALGGVGTRSRSKAPRVGASEATSRSKARDILCGEIKSRSSPTSRDAADPAEAKASKRKAFPSALQIEVPGSPSKRKASGSALSPAVQDGAAAQAAQPGDACPLAGGKLRVGLAWRAEAAASTRAMAEPGSAS
eukprot:scaffold2297_cov102-Isochrysis_galbana.AAC.6